MESVSQVDRRHELERAAAFARAIDATCLYWEDPPGEANQPFVPVVTIHCKNHGEVRCVRVWCLHCSRVFRPEAFIPDLQTEPKGQLVTTRFDVCDCGIDRLRAICEQCATVDCPEAEGPIG
jgi:hypothetical protein